MRCYLHILYGPEGSEELPKNVLLSFRRQIVDEDAPAGAVGGHAGQEGVAGQQVARQGREPKHDTLSWQSDILSSPDSLTGLQTSNVTGGVGGQMSEKVVYSYNTHLK